MRVGRSFACVFVFGLALAACESSPTPTPPRASTTSGAAEAPPAPPAPGPPDPLRCALALEVATFDPTTSGISAPVFVGDQALVAYMRREEDRTVLATRRMSPSGDLDAERVVVSESDVIGTPRLVAGGGRVAVTVTTRGETRLSFLDDTGAVVESPSAVALSGWPEALGLGPRGVVALPYGDGFLERVGLDGSAGPRVPIPHSPFMPDPAEELVACGARADLVLLRSGTAEAPYVAARALDGERPAHPLATDAGVSVAAGPSGFLAVVSAPEDAMNDLALHFFDERGVPRGDVVHLAGPEDGVRRDARAASLGDGWAITFWDGIGPALLRVDAAGRETAPMMPLRSGDERGGHTDARLATRPDAIAITWTVSAPLYGHGAPSERPDHPGPRVAIARCGDE